MRGKQRKIRTGILTSLLVSKGTHRALTFFAQVDLNNSNKGNGSEQILVQTLLAPTALAEGISRHVRVFSLMFAKKNRNRKDERGVARTRARKTEAAGGGHSLSSPWIQGALDSEKSRVTPVWVLGFKMWGPSCQQLGRLSKNVFRAIKKLGYPPPGSRATF